MSEKEIREEAKHRLEQIKRDRTAVKRYIWRCKTKEELRAFRKLNNLLEATERALENA